MASSNATVSPLSISNVGGKEESQWWWTRWGSMMCSRAKELADVVCRALYAPSTRHPQGVPGVLPVTPKGAGRVPIADPPAPRIDPRFCPSETAHLQEKAGG